MNFNEYIPEGGWRRWNKRRDMKIKIKSILQIYIPVLIILLGYIAVGYID